VNMSPKHSLGTHRSLLSMVRQTGAVCCKRRGSAERRRQSSEQWPVHVDEIVVVVVVVTPPAVGTGSGVLFSLDFFVCIFVSLYLCIFVSLFLCQQDYEKTAGPICMKFSGKVWSDHGTT